jgi:hypothetical protein
MKGAQLWIVSDIAPNARLLGVAKDLRIDLAAVGCGKDEGPAFARIALSIRSLNVLDLTPPDHLGEGRNKLGRDDCDPCPFLDQTLHLAQGNATTAHDQAATIFDFQRNGIHAIHPGKAIDTAVSPPFRDCNTEVPVNSSVTPKKQAEKEKRGRGEEGLSPFLLFSFSPFLHEGERA